MIGMHHPGAAAALRDWLRPDANTSPDRLFCHTYARGKGQARMIPGRPYSFVAALEPGRTSWTAMLDVLRVRPSDDHTDLAATQLRTACRSTRTWTSTSASRPGHRSQPRRHLFHTTEG